MDDDPGSGKSYIAQRIAAEGSRGRMLDGRIVEPFSTLYLTVENPKHEIMRPRFDMMGGDPTKFFLLEGKSSTVNGEEMTRAVTLADIPDLDNAIVKSGARFVVVDPFQSYLGANIDLHRSNETRPIMDALCLLAERHDVCILILRHLSKSGGSKAASRALGSIDVSGAARSVVLVGCLPDDPQARAMCHVKSNIGPMGHALGFSIDNEGRFSWTGESQITASDLLAPEIPELRGAKQEAEEWLRDALSAGSKGADELTKSAGGAGIKPRTLQRAKAALHVKSRKATFGGGSIWWLPENDP